MKHVLTALLLLTFSFPAFAGNNESAFERVMRTGVLRCGYYVFPPMVMRDSKTNTLSGLSVDMMNSIASRSGLKVEWAEEVTFGNWAPALQAGRFDAVCAPMWPEIPMARAAAFTIPMFYAGLSPLVRADDARFKNDLTRLNKSDVTFVTIEGNAIDILTREAFPKAKTNTMPASTDNGTILQEIITKKADAILLDRNAEIEYNKNNPTKLRLIDPKHPVKVQPFTLVVQRNEMLLKDFLDNAISELLNSGSIDRLLDKWESEPGMFLRVDKPYRTKP